MLRLITLTQFDVYILAALLSAVFPAHLKTRLTTRLAKSINRYKKRKRYQKYQAYLQSSKWKRKRNRILSRDNHTCQNSNCNNKKSLQVHHKTYKRLFNERDSDLVTLCKSCHAQVHRGK